MFADFRASFEKKDALEKKLSSVLASGSWSSNEEYVKLSKEYAKLRSVLDLYGEYTALCKSIENNETLLLENKDDPEMLALAEEESSSLKQKEPILRKRLMQKLLPPDENEGRPIIIEIRAGTGGEEAALFVTDMYRMYQRYCETIGLQTEVLSSSPAERGGLKEVILSIRGDNSWSQFKYESGTHRVQRVPKTETQGRIHTSAITVAIMPEAEEVEIVLDAKDIQVDVFRSSGSGGQSVNTMDSAVRITHFPTGLVVSCQDERSQVKNKQRAFRILRARMLERKQQEENKKRVEHRRLQIGSGDRSEKIRTYNFPQNRLTDHRIQYTAYNLDRVIYGQMEDLRLALSEAEYQNLMKDNP
jgi:peptide chain release factor 1